MKKWWKILIVILVLAIVIPVLVGILQAVMFGLGVVGMLRSVEEKSNEWEQERQQQDGIYDSIPQELIRQGLFDEDLQFVDHAYGWGLLSVDRTERSYFYIDPQLYDTYSHYWLEGVEEKDYVDHMNDGLGRYGDYVFHMIHISDLQYSEDMDYGNLHLKGGTTYYLTEIYEEAVYYKYVFAHGSGDNIRYDTDKGHNYKEESRSARYMLHMENDQWIVEKLQ